MALVGRQGAAVLEVGQGRQVANPALVGEELVAVLDGHATETRGPDEAVVEGLVNALADVSEFCHGKFSVFSVT